MKTFNVEMTVEIALDEKLLEDVLTEEWRKQCYPLHTPEEVAGHLAYNLVRGWQLKTLDGFANQPEERASIGHLDIVDVVALPPKPEPKPKPKRGRQ